MPCQKLGSEKPSTDEAMMPRPSGSSRYRPATSPSGMPMTQVSPMATTTSSKVAGMRCTISSMAGMPWTKDTPRSPCSARHRKPVYCCHTGRSSPRRAIMASRAAWLASGLTSSSIGSPTAYTAKKTTTETASSTNRLCINLRKMNRAT